MTDEAQRIRREYERRAREVPADLYSAANPGELYLRQARERALADLLAPDYLPLADRRILDVGCGTGRVLSDLETWGATRANMAGIDLDDDRVDAARRRLNPVRGDDGGIVQAGADLRVGDASKLPWDDGSFDLVLQTVVFSSILDEGMRRQVADEMARVLAPGGAVVWFDLRVGNPRNPNVRAVSPKELRALFPGFAVDARRIVLAPPIARRLVRVSWLGVHALQAMRVLNTHTLALLRRG